MNIKRTVMAFVVAGSLALAACTPGDETAPYDPNDAGTISIVAGSEQKAVLDGVVQPWCKSQGLTCSYDLLGSVDQARLLKDGIPNYDAFWFASSVFQQLGDASNVLRDVKPTFTSPIVYAGLKSEMQRLGLVGRDVSVEELVGIVDSDKTTVWATNPTQSNSGATTYLMFLNHFAGNEPGVPLTAEQLASKPVKDGITRFVQALDSTPPSTGTLMRECQAHPDRCKTLFTYEALVIEANQERAKQGLEPYYVVYPRGGLAISDSPLGFLPHGSNTGKYDNFKRLQTYLLSPDAQRKLLAMGRRPAESIGLALDNPPRDTFNPDWGIRADLRERFITYPAGPVIEQALTDYHLVFRRPTDAVYCLDGSGSMEGRGWDGVQQAASVLFDQSKAKQYLLQAGPGDRTTVIIFDDGIKAGPWTVPGNDQAELLGLRDKIKGVSPGGGTAIYDCLSRAAAHYRGPTGNSMRRMVFLMSDGDNTDGNDKGHRDLAKLGVPVITLAFGGANTDTLKDISNVTGGAFIGSGDLPTMLRQATGFR